MWKWASTNGGLSKRPPAFSSTPHAPGRHACTAWIRPSRIPTSRLRRPSGRLAFRMIRSNMLPPLCVGTDAPYTAGYNRPACGVANGVADTYRLALNGLWNRRACGPPVRPTIELTMVADFSDPVTVLPLHCGRSIFLTTSAAPSDTGRPLSQNTQYPPSQSTLPRSLPS